MLTVTAVATSCILSMLGLAPTLLSNPTGLATTLKVINTVSPITIHAASVEAGWHRPLTVHRLSFSTSTAPSSSSQSNNAATQSAIPLVSIKKIQTTTSLWNMVVAKNKQTDVILFDPELDASLANTFPWNLRILQSLQDAKLIPTIGPPSAVVKTTSPHVEPHPQLQPPPPLSLQTPTATIPFSADIQIGGMVTVAVPSGILLVPLQIQELILGTSGSRSTDGYRYDAVDRKDTADIGVCKPPCMHVQVLMGRTAIEEEEQELGLMSPPDTTPDTNLSLVEWAKETPNIPLLGVGTPLSPLAIRIDAPFLSCFFGGWRTSTGHTYFSTPIHASIDATPALANAIMQRLNPILGGTLSVVRTTTSEPTSGPPSRALSVTAMPHHHIWPSTGVSVRLDPLHLVVGQGSMLQRVLEVLKIVDGRIAKALSSSSLSTTNTTTSRQGVGVEVDTSPLEAEVALPQGVVRAKKVDMYVRVPGIERPPALHVMSWGTIRTSSQYEDTKEDEKKDKTEDTEDDDIDMTVAIGMDTLLDLLHCQQQSGGKQQQQGGGDEDGAVHGVGVHVGGSVYRPRVDLTQAAKDIALLVVESKARQWGSSAAGWMWEELGVVPSSGDSRGGRYPMKERFRIPLPSPTTTTTTTQ